MARAETKQRIPHLLLDTDFFDKPENIEAVDRFGDVAPAAILRLCLKMMNEEGAKMKRSQVLAMWRASGTEQSVWAEIVEYYISCEWLSVEDDYLCSIRVQKEKQRVDDKRKMLSANAQQTKSNCSANAKQMLSKSKANAKQSASKSSDTVTDTVTEIDSETDLDSKEKKAKPEREKFGDHVYLSESEYLKFKEELGDEALDRCIEKLNAWISSNPNIDRKRNGKNAAATFRSWVINAIAEEQARGRRTGLHDPNAPNGKLTSSEKTMQAAQSFLNKMENRGY